MASNYEVDVVCPHCGKTHPVCPGQLIGRIKSKAKAKASRINGTKNKGKPRYTIRKMINGEPIPGTVVDNLENKWNEQEGSLENKTGRV